MPVGTLLETAARKLDTLEAVMNESRIAGERSLLAKSDTVSDGSESDGVCHSSTMYEIA